MTALSSSPLAKFGARAEIRRTMGEGEQALMTGATGNMHPLYVDEVHARAAGAGGRLLFELAVAGLAATALAAVAGSRMRVAELRLAFPAPARLGDTIAATAEVVKATEGCAECRLACVRDGDGALLAEGHALLEAVGAA
jgi:acyl dehydratase